jgi:hypothetical protein
MEFVARTGKRQDSPIFREKINQPLHQPINQSINQLKARERRESSNEDDFIFALEIGRPKRHSRRGKHRTDKAQPSIAHPWPCLHASIGKGHNLRNRPDEAKSDSHTRHDARQFCALGNISRDLVVCPIPLQKYRTDCDASGKFWISQLAGY